MRSSLKIEEIQIAPGARRIAIERLDTWKEIANYLKRSVRCAQRWEREEGLPVYRLLHKSNASLYAYRAELDEWCRCRTQQIIVARPRRGPRCVAVFASKEGIVLPQTTAGRTSWTR